MSEILIPNVDLPKKEGDATYLRIDSYGHVFQYDNRTIEMRTIAKVVELPPHGRLIDATELEASDAIIVGEDAWNMVHNAPTVLESSN